jgi:hypothetical protein
MEKPLLIKSVFMFFNLWTIGIIFLWFRRSIEIFWKIIATLLLGFYFWFFYEELMSGYMHFTADWYTMVITFLTELLTITFTNLFFLWPVVLIVIFYKADDIGAERLLKFMCILTLVLWIIFVLYIFYNKGINKFLYENLREMIPGAQPLKK